MVAGVVPGHPHRGHVLQVGHNADRPDAKRRAARTDSDLYSSMAFLHNALTRASRMSAAAGGDFYSKDAVPKPPLIEKPVAV